MARYVALIRGINVGTAKRVGMAPLRAALEAAGLTDVATYIASGNVVFTATGSTKKLATDVERVLADELGVPARVAVRTAADMRRVMRENPYLPDAEEKALHVNFFVDPPTAEQREALPQKVDDHELRLGKHEAYLHLPDGLTGSKLVPRRLGTVETSRNWRTVCKLVAMLDARD